MNALDRALNHEETPEDDEYLRNLWVRVQANRKDAADELRRLVQSSWALSNQYDQCLRRITGSLDMYVEPSIALAANELILARHRYCFDAKYNPVVRFLTKIGRQPNSGKRQGPIPVMVLRFLSTLPLEQQQIHEQFQEKMSDRDSQPAKPRRQGHSRD
jgi:hypothetical protein